MESIKSAVKDVMLVLESKKNNLGCCDFKNLLNKFLTKSENRHIKFNNFKRGIITISVDSSNWLYHLNLKKDELLNNVRKEVKELKDIRFYIGEIK